MKSYFLVFNSDQVDRQAVIRVIDKIPEIVNWSAFFPSAIALVCTENASTVCQKIRDLRETDYQFFVVEKTSNSNGWLGKSTWKFVNNPKAADAED